MSNKIGKNNPISDNRETKSLDKIVQDKTSNGSIFSIRKQQICCNDGQEDLFNYFDTDKDGKLNSQNLNGENEIENFQQYINNLKEDEKNNSNKSKEITAKIADTTILNEYNITNGLKNIYENLVNFVKGGYDDSKIYFRGKVVDDSSINGKIDSVKQGHIGDCWLLSQLNALSGSKSGKKAIKDAITKNNNGSFNVRINKHTNEIIHISQEEIENALSSDVYSKGDLDVLLFELAYEKYYKSNAEKEGIDAGNSPGAALNGGNMHPKDSKYKSRNIISMLTDYETMNVNVLEDKKNIYDTILKNFASKKDTAIILSSHYNIKTRQKMPEGDRDANHSYTVKNIKLDNNGEISEIIVVNPWDNEKEISITYEEFCKMAYDISISSSKNDMDSAKSSIKKSVIQNIKQCTDVDSLISQVENYSYMCLLSRQQLDMDVKSTADDTCTKLIDKDPYLKKNNTLKQFRLSIIADIFQIFQE